MTLFVHWFLLMHSCFAMLAELCEQNQLANYSWTCQVCDASLLTQTLYCLPFLWLYSLERMFAQDQRRGQDDAGGEVREGRENADSNCCYAWNKGASDAQERCLYAASVLRRRQVSHACTTHTAICAFYIHPFLHVSQVQLESLPRGPGTCGLQRERKLPGAAYFLLAQREVQAAASRSLDCIS